MPRLFSILAATTVCLTLGGCAHQGLEPVGFAWSFQQNPDEGVKLAYGQPQSDNVLLMMTCEPGSSRVLLSAPGEEIVLATRQGRERFEGQSMDYGGLQLVEAEARAAAPSLTAFERTGDLAMMAGRQRIDLAAAPAEQAGVRRFFEACRA